MTDILVFIVGIIVGVMNAIAGGGMLIGFPVLLAVGLPAIVANATSPLVVLPGQLSSAYGYRKYLRKVPRYYLWLLLPCLVGGTIGATALRRFPHQEFEHLLPGLILFAVVLFTFQPFLHLHIHRHLHSRKKKDYRTLWLIGLALLPLAVYGGFFGAGFGFIMLAFLGFTSLHDTHQMNAMKNVAAVGIAIVAVITLSGANLIDWRTGLFMAAGNFIGGYVGATGAQKVSSHAIRIVVIAIGFCTAGYLFFRFR